MPIDADYVALLPPLKFTIRRWRGKRVWVVEARDATRFLPFPVGQAWVLDYPEHEPPYTSLEFILVADQYRRRGVGEQLILAARDRWPELSLTAAISSEGRKLIKKVTR